jgi:DHA2 family multidrug resistance protein
VWRRLAASVTGYFAGIVSCRKRGQAIAFWALGIVVAPMLGPVAGGWLTDNYSWRWVFYINVPIGVLAMFLTQA